MWDKRAEYVDNHDGDTIKVNLDQGFGDIKENVNIRLMGVWAPELSQPGGVECRDFVRQWFADHDVNPRWNFIVTTARMKVADSEQMTFNRYVAVVTSLDGSDNLNLDISAFVAKNGYSGGVGS
jgi:endonuclease YncB( thermonuclease family)